MSTDNLFMLLERLSSVEQRDWYHPEGNVLNHSLQVFKHALRESDDYDLVFAALFHDIGKFENIHGHDKIGTELLEEVFNRVSFSGEYDLHYLRPMYVSKVLWLVEQHVRIWDYLEGHMHKYSSVVELPYHIWFNDLIRLARFDKLGRNPNVKLTYNRISIEDKLAKLWTR